MTVELFTAVTKTPRGLNYERNEGNSDNIFGWRWPPGTWNSMTQRALYLATRFERTAASSNGKLVPIRTARDPASYLSSEKRIAGSPRIRGTSQPHSWSIHFAALVTLRLCLSVP
jgi:hypothetical protein